MPAKPAIAFPSHLRLLRPDGSGYGSAVAIGDRQVLTVEHLGAKPGIKIQSGPFIRIATAVRKITIPGLTTGTGSEGNRAGDLVLIDLDFPFPKEVIPARISKRPAAGKAWVTHHDGKHSPRVIVRLDVRYQRARGQGKADLPPDYLDPRWLVLDRPTAKTRPLAQVGGDSGGAIYNARGELISLVSRVDGGMGPNLTHADAREALAAPAL